MSPGSPVPLNPRPGLLHGGLQGQSYKQFLDLANDFLIFFTLGTLGWWERGGKYEVSARRAVSAAQYNLERVGQAMQLDAGP